MEIAIMKQYMAVFIVFTSSYIHLLQYYDIRKKCEGSLCYDFSNMEKFLNQESVRDSLGVGKIRFVSCSTEVYAAMLVDWMRNLEVGIPALLDDGINLLIYAGEYDLICNWLGKHLHLIYLRFVEKFII
jgi:serine carboxypeptidase-like clade 4